MQSQFENAVKSNSESICLEKASSVIAVDLLFLCRYVNKAHWVRLDGLIGGFTKD